MNTNVSVVRFKFRFNILISGKIIKEMPGSVASGTSCTLFRFPFTEIVAYLIYKLKQSAGRWGVEFGMVVERREF